MAEERDHGRPIEPNQTEDVSDPQPFIDPDGFPNAENFNRIVIEASANLDDNAYVDDLDDFLMDEDLEQGIQPFDTVPEMEIVVQNMGF